MATRVLQHTLDALKIFDEGKAARAAAWETVRCNADIDVAFKADEDALATLRAAFFEDTKEWNSFDVCQRADERWMRYSATGHPGDGTIHIGAVGFARLIPGEVWGIDGSPKWAMTSLIMDERVNLLMDVYEGKPLPEGMILVGDIGGTVEIKASAVNWTTSGVPGMRERSAPRAGVANLRR